MTTINQVIQQPAAGEYIELFVLDATSIGGGVYRFTLAQYANSQVSFGGQDYPPYDVEFVDMETSSTGALPQPTLRVRNFNFAFSTLITSFADGVGARLQRLKTFRNFLDGEPDADPSAYLSLDIFVIEQKTAADKTIIEWKLSSVIDQEGQQLPARNILRDTCTWVYRIWNAETNSFDYSQATCPYTGSAMFDLDNNPVTDPTQDSCSHQINGCKARFGTGGNLPASFFPGVARFNGGSFD